MKKLSVFILSLIAISCTQNNRAKNWGGQAEYTLPKGQKLINITWKETNLWYLTRPMKGYRLSRNLPVSREKLLG